MKAVTETEFKAHIERLNAVPDGFKIVGSYQQTKWFVNGVEVGRKSQDSFGIIWEIQDLTLIK